MKKAVAMMSIFGMLLCVLCVIASGIGIDCSAVQSVCIEENVGVVRTYEETVPSAYNDDYTNLQYVTSVKNQGPLEMCWAFAACAAAESDAIKNHGADASTIDLSEWHLGYFAYNGERIGTDDSIQYIYSSPYYSVGGNDLLSMHTLMTGIGFADESVADYDDLVSAVNSGGSTSLDSALLYECQYYVSNVLIYDLPSQQDDVKRAILTYGAVSTSYYSGSYFNKTNSAFYCYEDKGVNHAVTIVGWDDDYPKENFTTYPSNNGAWLIKNSWGSGWGLDGYFWISYEDKSMKSATAYDVVEADRYDNIYQHDGGIKNTSVSGASFDMGNVFECQGDETITAVGVETCETTSQSAAALVNQTYELKIYTGVDNSSGLSLGTLAHSQSGTFEYVGFNTIELTSSVELTAGEKFFVWIRSDAYIGVDIAGILEMKNINNETLSIAQCNVVVNAGESYAKTRSGTIWNDCVSYFNSGSVPVNPRIKAYTVYSETGVAVVDSKPVLSSISYGQKIGLSTIVGGVVKDSINGNTISGEWSFDNPDAICTDMDEVAVTFTPQDSRYSSVNVQLYADVDETLPTITFTQTLPSGVSAGQNVAIVATACNPYNLTLNDIGEIKYSYKLGDSGVWTDMSGNTLTVPTSAPVESKLYVRASTTATSGKYQQNREIVYTTVKALCILRTYPVASCIKYGQKLSSSNIGGGVVEDEFSGVVLEGEWSFVSGDMTPQATAIQDVVFRANNSNYAPLHAQISVTVEAAKPIISVVSSLENWTEGQQKTLEINVANAYDGLVAADMTIKIFYSVDNVEFVQAQNGEFVVPQPSEEGILYIKIVADGIEGKYLTTTKLVQVQVEKADAPQDEDADESGNGESENDGDQSVSGNGENSDGVLGRLSSLFGAEQLANSAPFVIVVAIVVVIIIVAVKKIKNR
ncbi:MAG: lectin like domain-containing protein [Christensenellales bacterium]